MITKTQAFLREFNEAFVKQDVAFILENVTDDIVWTMVGSFHLEGKEEVKKALEGMKGEHTQKLTIELVITHGRLAAVSGTIEMREAGGEEKTYSFCDTYQMRGPKIKEMKAYMIETK